MVSIYKQKKFNHAKIYYKGLVLLIAKPISYW